MKSEGHGSTGSRSGWMCACFCVGVSACVLLVLVASISVSVSPFVSAPVSACVFPCHAPIVILLASNCAVLGSLCSHFVSRIRVRSRDVRDSRFSWDSVFLGLVLYSWDLLIVIHWTRYSLDSAYALELDFELNGTGFGPS